MQIQSQTSNFAFTDKGLHGLAVSLPTNENNKLVKKKKKNRISEQINS